ncbi:MAG: hypothetical protein MUE95_12560 [Cyclobacteriaceae bacterium]|jgi:hypothetical protein|nr:hypothetical protein [Cyclobacteriaceae bacterium]
MKPLSLTLLLVLKLSLATAQEELQENVRYEGNTKIKISALGIQFTIPSNWYGGVSAGSPYMVLADAGDEMTIIISADEMSEANVLREMQQQIALDENISIKPAGTIRKEGKRWYGDYSILGATQDLKCFVEVNLGDHNIGAAMILMAYPAAFDAGKRALSQLASSMQFTAPVAAPAATASTGPDKPYSDYLKGKSLKYYYTQGDFSDTDFIHLCSNGTFTRSKNTISGGVTGTGSMWGKENGTWKATGQGSEGVLTLYNQDGTQNEFRMQYREGTKGLGLYLNGYRYYVEGSSQCN